MIALFATDIIYPCFATSPLYISDMTIKAIIHKAEEGGFWAEVPALPGCLTQGETRAEVETNLREAIDLWLSVGDEKS